MSGNIVKTGVAGQVWAKRFGEEPSEPYLVFCLAQKKVDRKEKWEQIEEINTFALSAIREG